MKALLERTRCKPNMANWTYPVLLERLFDIIYGAVPDNLNLGYQYEYEKKPFK